MWAKTDKSSGWHPLLHHLIETGEVAALLWDHVLAAETRQIIGQGLGLSVSEARNWCLFLVAAHDLGKASPCFQIQCQELIGSLQQEGFSFPANADPLPHGQVTAIALTRALQQQNVPAKIANELARAVGGHHGIIATAADLQLRRPRAMGEGGWETARTSILQALGERYKRSGQPTKRELPALTLLAGLTTVADWIASSAEHFPYNSERELSFPLLCNEAERKAAAALSSLGWLTRLQFPDPLSFEQLFRIAEPRPLQTECIRLAEELPSPSLVIVEAPMGEGKTEAALYLAGRLSQRHQLRGLYFALPTQATSNQIFGRVIRAFSEGGASGTANLLLLHGHASLSTAFEALTDAGRDCFLPTAVEPDGFKEAQLMAGEWFTFRKRGLLAPFGVGTIDQALLAGLQSKHVFVRLLGLAGKVVVIDEVHAYDTYMSALLERLLEWLRSIGTSVILLSATLPASRRTALVRAFTPEAEALPGDVAYPTLTVAGDGQARTRGFAPASASRRVALHRVPPEAGAVAEWVRERTERGGCAAIICNTVGRAQEIYRACREAMAGLADDGYPIVEMLHSRFAFEDRESRETRVLHRFGKPGESCRPHRAVLVATQIIEQSLDIDFDVMVSELPPIDLLLQRSGRLHRHRREQRPCGDTPTLGLIEIPLTEGGVPAFSRGETWVYDEHVLLRSWITLQGRTELFIPDSIRNLVEAVYAEPGIPPNDTVVRALWETTALKRDEARESDRRQARNRYLPKIGANARLELLTDMGREDDESLHPHFRALTRIAEHSVTAICLFGNEEQAFLDRECSLPVAATGRLSTRQAEQILRRSCPVSDQRVVRATESARAPANWKRSALLRNCRPLYFGKAPQGEASRCPFETFQVLLCPETGLRVETNPTC